MVAILEAETRQKFIEINPVENSEVSSEPYFIFAAELPPDEQEWLAEITGGSFQIDPYYPDETSVYYKFAAIGLIFLNTGGFGIAQKDNGAYTYYQDRRDHTDIEEYHPNAVIVFESGSISIIWPAQTDQIQYGFGCLSTNPLGINNKEVEIHPIQDINIIESPILLEAVQMSYQRSLLRAA